MDGMGESQEDWWEDWARDTVRFIREVDPSPQHIIYLEDPAGDALNPSVKNTVGLDLTRVARHFDAVGAYTSASWSSSPNSGAKVAQHARDVLAQLRKVIQPEKLTIYTFWVANAPEERKPGPARYPSQQNKFDRSARWLSSREYVIWTCAGTALGIIA
jgi:hypothetical protein